MQSQLFAGIKVLDVTKVFSGPFAARMFADYGAEVIKVEHPTFPDDSRNFPPLISVDSAEGASFWSGYFELLNRNKRGLALDLKDPKDRELFYDLAKTADVVIENLTPRVKYDLQIDYETLSKCNPRLIYASLSGEGQESNNKFYDVIAQAKSGLLSLSGTPEKPMKIGPSVIDTFSGMTLAFGISSALYQRERTGQGQFLAVDMVASGIQLLEANLVETSVTGKNPERPGNQDSVIAPFGVYSTADGHIVLAVGNDQLWKKLAHWMKEVEPKLAYDLFTSNRERLQNQVKLTQTLEGVFAHFSSKELVEKLQQLEIPISEVREMSDVLQDSSLFDRKVLVKFTHPEVGEIVLPGRPVHFGASGSEVAEINEVIRRAPSLGEHADEYR